MATVLKAAGREFEELPGKTDDYRIFSDISRIKSGINPLHLNFDLRRLDPGRYSAPYHFHRYAEEMFMIVSGAATLRSPQGLEPVESGDMIFFESGSEGAHQLYNHTDEPCVFLDVRSSVGYDVCEYPDSGKILLAPSFEIFRKDSQVPYFEGEAGVGQVWERLEEKQ